MIEQNKQAKNAKQTRQSSQTEARSTMKDTHNGVSFANRHYNTIRRRSFQQRMISRVFLLIMLLSLVPFAPMTHMALAEEPPSESILGGDDGELFDEDEHNNPGQVPHSPSLQQEDSDPSIGDLPPDMEDIPTPISVTSPDKALAPMMIPAQIGANSVKLRNGPGLEFPSVQELPAGSKIEMVGRSGDWILIREHINAPMYWVSSEMIDAPEHAIYSLFTVKITVPAAVMAAVTTNNDDDDDTAQEDESAPEPVGVVNGDSATLRNGPGSLYEEVTTVTNGMTVTLQARHEDWFHVALSDGTNGWLFGELLTIDAKVLEQVAYTDDIPELPAAPVHASGDIASYALEFVGHPYVYGGTTPAGFDCSGFVQYVYAQHDIYLPRVAAEQFSTSGAVPVPSMDDLEPGDIMFFVNTSTPGISHVAIYTGMGRMVHAVSEQVGVAVSDVWDGYWVSHYHGAIRIPRS